MSSGNSSIEERVKEIERLLFGDKRLGMTPLIERLDNIETGVENIRTERQRERIWLKGVGLGLGANVLGVVMILIKLFAA